MPSNTLPGINIQAPVIHTHKVFIVDTHVRHLHLHALTRKRTNAPQTRATDLFPYRHRFKSLPLIPVPITPTISAPPAYYHQIPTLATLYTSSNIYYHPYATSIHTRVLFATYYIYILCNFIINIVLLLKSLRNMFPVQLVCTSVYFPVIGCLRQLVEIT